MTVRISWSSLRTHDECKQKSHLARTKKLALLDDKRGFFPGTVTDRVVRNWLNDDPAANLGIMPDMVAATVDIERKALSDRDEGVVRWRGVEDKKKIIQECREAVTLIEPALLKYVVPFEYQADFHFEAPLFALNPRTGARGRILLNGYMDILVRDDKQRWWVFDVKHTRDNSYWRKTVGQLGFYDLAIELMFGQSTALTGLLQPLCSEKMKPYKPTPESRAQLMQRVLGMARDIWSGIQTPVTGNGPCSYCPTRHACVKFQPVRDAKGQKRMPL